MKTDAFSTRALEYDSWYDGEEGRPLYTSELECLSPLVSHTPVLEVGVGTGRFAMHFPGSYGIDPAFEALEMAKKRGVRSVQGLGERLPFKDGVFGTVLIVLTLCFVKDPLEVLKEAERVIRRDGEVIICFIPVDSPWGRLYGEKKKRGSPFYRGARFYTFEEVGAFVRRAGLDVTRTRSTLLQGPADSRRIEKPFEGPVKGAGFVCVKAAKA